MTARFLTSAKLLRRAIQKDRTDDLGNIGGISDAGLGVSDAIHRANITVDERGTEAAAVTGTAFLVRGGCGPTAVRAGHPFAFAMVDRSTKAPLFIGHVADPTDTTHPLARRTRGRASKSRGVQRRPGRMQLRRRRRPLAAR